MAKQKLRTVGAALMLTPQQVAERLGVSVDSVYRACEAGRLRSSKFGHSTLRIRPEWLEDYIEASATKAS